MEFASRLFDPAGFPARWQCGSGWSETPWLGWMHILSDIGVWTAYVAIPFVLIYFLLRRKDLPFRKIFLLFGAFILACGTTHVLEAIIFWWPIYRLAGVVKLLTAIVSWATVLALFRLVPRVLTMRTPEELEREIAARKSAEEELQRVNTELEQRVEHRTLDLTHAVAALREERELLRTTLGSIGDGVIATDPQGLVTFLNPVAEKMTGWTTADAHGLPLGQIFRIVNEHTRVRVENPAIRTLREGVVVGLANHTVLIAKDGTERAIDDRASPIRNGDNTVAGSVLVFRDVTERKIEEAARAERSRLVALRADIATALSSDRSISSILQKCCEAFVEHLDVAFARIWTLSDSESILELRASAGLYTHLDGPHSRVPVGEFKIGRIAATRQPHLTNAVPEDPNVSDREWAAKEGMVAFAGYPLIVEDRLVGVVAMFARRALSDGILKELAPLAEVIAQFIERRRVQESLQRQAELHRVTLASIGDAVITTDAEGRVVFLNDVATSLTAWTDDEAKGQPSEVVFRIVNEQSGETVASPIERVIRERVIVGLANHTILIGKDGARHPIEDSGAPIQLGGKLVGVVLVFRDVSERRQKEKQLREGQERLAFALEAADLGQWDLNLKDHTTQRTLRHDQIYGYDSFLTVWHYEKSLEHIVPEDRQLLTDRFNESVATGSVWSVEFRIRRIDGAERWVWAKARIKLDELGQAHRMVGIIGDFTERRHLEDNLRQLVADSSEADRRKDEFLATLAHELRNPLAPIRSGLQVLKMASRNGQSVEQAQAMMERQLGHMVRLVDDLLDVSRITRNKLELRKERIELAKVVASAVETCRPLIEANGHELTVALPSASLWLEADFTRLTQVFSNLLNNAAKYTQRGGKIELTAVREGEEVFVSIKDNGIGIRAEMLPKVFEMFTQSDRALERAQGGLGIGLTLVKRLVEMHEGSVEARSEGTSRGSEFVVRLPLVEEKLVPDTPETAPDVQNVAKKRILVVDDNLDAATTLGMLLSLMGNETHTAHDGLEAVEAASAFQPDLIMLDIGLPKLNGYEACRRIRELPHGNEIFIIACTGWGQEEDIRLANAAGFDRHMVKPIDPTALQKFLEKGFSKNA